MKSRFTITLPPELLAKVDNLVDKKDIRNRSHAIEHLIRTSLPPTVNTAVILAAKNSASILKIDSQPLINLTLSHLHKFGIKHVIIAGGSHTAKIKAIITPLPGQSIDYLAEPKPLGTAGVIKRLASSLRHRFLVVHGDILTSLNLKDFIAFHETERTLATIAVKPRLSEKNYGKVLLQGNRIIEFVGPENNQAISLVNTGIYLFEPQVTDLISATPPVYLETDLFPKLASTKQLAGFFFQGVWFDISNPTNYRQALKRWQERR